MKKVIKNEGEFKRWILENYEKIGFSGIVRKDIGICPDLILLRDGKEVRVELETVASNFLLHKHDLSKVDEVICLKKDAELARPTREIKELKLRATQIKK